MKLLQEVPTLRAIGEQAAAPPTAPGDGGIPPFLDRREPARAGADAAPAGSDGEPAGGTKHLN